MELLALRASPATATTTRLPAYRAAKLFAFIAKWLDSALADGVVRSPAVARWAYDPARPDGLRCEWFRRQVQDLSTVRPSERGAAAHSAAHICRRDLEHFLGESLSGVLEETARTRRACRTGEEEHGFKATQQQQQQQQQGEVSDDDDGGGRNELKQEITFLRSSLLRAYKQTLQSAGPDPSLASVVASFAPPELLVSYWRLDSSVSAASPCTAGSWTKPSKWNYAKRSSDNHDQPSQQWTTGVTLCTHCSLSRLDEVDHLLLAWPRGHLAVAVWVPPAAKQHGIVAHDAQRQMAQLNTGQAAVECALARWQRRSNTQLDLTKLAVAVIVHDDSSSSPPDLRPGDGDEQLDDMTPVSKAAAFLRGSAYPINVARNVAAGMSQTTLSLSVDVDVVPGSGLRRLLLCRGGRESQWTIGTTTRRRVRCWPSWKRAVFAKAKSLWCLH